MKNLSTLSVLLPTWRRPDSLSRCLLALARQTRPAEQVVVTVRRDDAATWARLDELRDELGPAFEAVAVEPGPLTAAMNAGLSRTRGDLVALTDDDAEPREDWLERLAAWFADQSIGGVGGRDWQPHERWDVEDVGRVAWFGRVGGNHHLGVGPPRDVDVLKGVNCCFRGDVLRRVGFDRRLRGRGNVSHWEMPLCFAFVRAGWRLVYDPAVTVDHHVAPRHDGDTNARGDFARDPYVDSVHNETLALLEHLTPARRAAFAAWAILVGTREAPGLAQVPRLTLLEGRPTGLTLRRFAASLRGRAAGLASWSRGGLASAPRELSKETLPA